MSNDLLSPKLEELSQAKETESLCTKLIYEFLLCNNFNKTLNTFREEIDRSSFSLPAELPLRRARIERDDVLKIISALEMEDHLQFFERWTKLVPSPIRELPDYQNLTLPLYTYFATLPARKGVQSSPKQLSPSNERTDSCETKTNKIDEKYKNVNSLSQLEDNLTGTFTLDKPTIIGNEVEISSASERELDMEPDSLESDAEASESEGRRRKPSKSTTSWTITEEEDNEAIVIYDEDTKENIILTDNMTNSMRNEEVANGMDTREASVKKSEKVAVKSGRSAMSLFQDYLLQRRSTFTSSPQDLQLFALPFIDHPEEHQAFQHIFQDKWVRDLKTSLYNFLIKFSCGDDVVPEIVKICREDKERRSEEEGEERKMTPPLNEDCSKLYRESRRKLHQLKRDHKNLVGIASELASALENSVRGEAVDLKTTLYKCTTIFPELFPNSQVLDYQCRNGDSSEKVEKEKRWLKMSEVDRQKVKEDLRKGSIKCQLLLLQALRWWLCEAEGEERGRLVRWLDSEDGLGLAGVGRGTGRSWLASPEPHPLQQALARLLNCLASLRLGRDYIASVRPSLVPLFVARLTSSSSQDSITQDMLLALLQKLSLRKELCTEMKKAGLLDWLPVRLSQSESTYQLEYTTSLFMNLSLEAPVDYWDNRPSLVLPPLLALLQSTSTQVVEFVLGSLTCLLRSDKLNIFARSLGLSARLSGLKGRCQRQTAQLLRLHCREVSLAALSLPPASSEEDIEDPEELEDEVNRDDEVRGTPCGSELLRLHYRLDFSTSGIVGEGGGNGDRPALRPTTPRASPSLPTWAF